MRSFRFPLFVLALALFALPLKAQTSVYGSVDLAHFGYRSDVDSNGNYNPNGSGYSEHQRTASITFGGTYLFPSSSRLKAGVDLRGIYGFRSQGGGAGFASLRIAFVPHHNPLAPYFQIGGGAIGTQVPSYVTSNSAGNILTVNPSQHVTGGAADILFGLEIKTGTPWSIRALEFGGYAGNKTALATVGAGVIYTFAPRS